ncbi:MAG TPA: four helix bundle protein [Ohtaekwangia sp.]
MAFKFEKLEIWKESVNLSAIVHEVTLKFPRAEIYVLTSQIKRASDSISLNIAEGSTGQSNPEFRRFLGYAVRSGVEVVACLYLARKRNIISENDFDKIYSSMDLLIKRIQALRKTII